MAVAFTPSQREVIDARKQNILVSAAAGSGKTAVLVQRIVDLVCDKSEPVDVDHLLVVTFTEAAAAEMKTRVSKALNQRLEEEYASDDTTPEHEAMIQHLERQNVLIHRSFIMTIDAFCKFVVSNNYTEAGLEPQFRVMDEGERRLLQDQVIEDLFEDLYQQEDAQFFDAIEGISDRGKDEELKELVLKLYTTSESFPWPDKWLEEASLGYKAFDHSRWLDRLIGDVKLRLECAIAELENAKYICMQAADDLANHIKILENDITMFQAILVAANSQGDCSQVYDAIEAAIANKPDYQVWARSGKDKELKGKAKALRDDAKKILDKIVESYFFITRSVWQQELEATGNRMDTVIGLVREFGKRFSEAKSQEALVDFSDLEHKALQVLLIDEDESRPSEIAREYQQYFSEIMIDEYQDSNEVQEVLLKALCREHLEGELHRANRFMVGDVKQSIYRFRKADPGLIIQKMKDYSLDKSSKNRRIDLQANFRSRKEVLDCVNTIFEKIMIPEVGGVRYDQAAQLNLGSTEYQEAEGLFKPELHLISPDIDVENAFEIQANALADIIEEQLRCGRVSDNVVDPATGKRKLRPVNFGDIAILVRTMKVKGDTIRKVFGDRGIPVKVVSSEKYYNSVEISQVLQFLKVLDNPLQDVAFYGACLSPMGGFSDEDMAELKVEYPEGYFFQKFEACVRDYIENGKTGGLIKSGLVDRVDKFLDIYKELRDMSKYENLEHLIARLYELTGFRYYVSALTDGESRLNNLELLLDRARQFAQTSYSGIFNFLQYVDRLMESEKEPSGAGNSNESSNEVKVYTMHKSKGLEFPVCIVCDLQTLFNLKDEQAPFLLDNELGVACNYTDTVKRIRRDTLMRKVFSKKEDLDTKGENLRILYVALTRAKEKLIMVGSLPKSRSKKENPDRIEEYLNSWQNTWEAMGTSADYNQVASCNSFLEMVMYGFEKYRGNIIFHNASEWADKRIDNTIEAIERQNNDRILVWAIENAGDTYTDFEKNMSLEYAHSELEGLYTKTSVSELKMAAMQDAMDGEGPRWMYEDHGNDKAIYDTGKENTLEDKVDAAEKADSEKTLEDSKERAGNKKNGVNLGALYGTAQHRAMELVDFSKNLDMTDEVKRRQWVCSFIKEKYNEGCIDRELINLVNVKKIDAFLSSDYAKRMGQAELDGKLYREQPFFLSIPASELDKKYPASESLLIQGIIDVYWIENDEIVLLDYKTDNVSEVHELVTRYKTQMDYYARALAQGLGKKIKEQILYSFKLNEFVVL